MPSSNGDIIQSALPEESINFFSLPYEIRLQIYETYIHSRLGRAINDRVVHVGWSVPFPLAVFQICQQIREETLPILFKKMIIERGTSYWRRFLYAMGPRSISLVRTLTIDYKCYEDDHNCKDDLYNDEIVARYHGNENDDQPGPLKCPVRKRGNFKRWESIFDLFTKAQPKLKTFTVYMYHCHGFTIDPCRLSGDCELHLDKYFPWDPTKSSDDTGADEIDRTLCLVYRAPKFLEFLSSLGNMKSIALWNPENPVWVKYLQQTFGPILKQRLNDEIIIYNKDSSHVVGLDGYEPSARDRDVYFETDENGEIEEQSKNLGLWEDMVGRALLHSLPYEKVTFNEC